MIRLLVFYALRLKTTTSARLVGGLHLDFSASTLIHIKLFNVNTCSSFASRT